MPERRNPGNAPEVDEYLRRQTMSFRDYAGLLDRLARDFPGESFLLVRYGDHQPDFASFMLEPWLDELGINRRLMTYDPRYFTTYYAIDAINFKPVNLSSALDTIEGPYLPLVVQEAAGLPLDPSFTEQKRIRLEYPIDPSWRFNAPTVRDARRVHRPALCRQSARGGARAARARGGRHAGDRARVQPSRDRVCVRAGRSGAPRAAAHLHPGAGAAVRRPSHRGDRGAARAVR